MGSKHVNRRPITDQTTRFWNLVDKDPNGCWLWKGAVRGWPGDRARGYGQFMERVRDNRDGDDYVATPAHRYSWTITFGPIPDELFVLHRCDRAACVRPDHLFLGTQADNMADKVSKGRQARGTKNGRGTISDEIVAEIKRRLALGDRGVDIARATNTTPSYVSIVKHGKARR